MKPAVIRCIAVGLGITVLTAGTWGVFSAMCGAASREALKSNDLTGIRRQALSMFPRGTRLDEVSEQLAQIGFLCEPMKNTLGDISAPALVCASNGRGYPNYPAVNLTVSTRNGLVSEIEVWNVMQRSDSGPARSRVAGDVLGPMFSALEDPSL